MAIYKLGEFEPKIEEGTYIAESADVVGRVTLKKNASVWNNAVLRGDIDSIEVGENSNVQDLCVLHVNFGQPLKIGNNVTIGHSVTLHGCTIGDSCLIGMGSTILDEVEIGENSLVAAGTVIAPGKKFPPRSFIRGIPGKLVRELSQEEVEGYAQHYSHYTTLKNEYLKRGVVRIDINNKE